MSVVKENIILRCDYCKNALFHSQTPYVGEARDHARNNPLCAWDFYDGKDACPYCVAERKKVENA